MRQHRDHPMHVRILPPSRAEIYRRDFDEPDFCHYNDIVNDPPGNCNGIAEISIGNIRICRACAQDIADQLQTSIHLLDAGTAGDWLQDRP